MAAKGVSHRQLGVSWGDFARFLGAITLMLFLAFQGLSLIDDVARKEVLEIAEDRINDRLLAREIALRLQVDRFQAAVRGASALPSINTFVDQQRQLSSGTPDPQLSESRALTRESIERLFVSVADAGPLVRQIRIISADSGMELIRVDRRDGRVSVIPEDALQDKGDRDYFRETLTLPPMSVRLSRIELNREHGEIELPRWPTMRASTPLYDSQGKLFGAFVVNFDADILLREPTVFDSDANLRYFVLGDDGEFLVHPDPAMTFQFERERSHRWSEFYPAAPDGDWDTGPGISAFSMDGSVVLGGRRPVSLADSEQTRLELVVTTAPQWLEGKLSDAKRRYGPNGALAWLVCSAIILYLIWVVYRKNQLVAQNDEYRGIIRQTMSGVMSVSADNQVIFCNSTGLDILGLKAEDIVGRNLFSVVAPLDEDLGPDTWFEKLSSQDIGGTEVSLNVLSGSGARPLELQVTATHITTGGFKRSFYALLFTDNSEKVASRRRTEAAKDELEKLVVERTEELERSRNLAISSSQIKTDFIANLSHELRTPLHGIVASLRLLRQDRLNERQRHRLILAEESMAELTEVINSILDVSKLEADKLDIEETDLSLPTLIDDVARRYAVKAAEKGLPLYVDMRRVSNQLVYGDYARIARIIANLLDNAVKVTKTGEIRISAKTSPRGEHETLFECEVVDTGPGVPEAVRAGVMEGFYPGSHRAQRVPGGEGLGLSMAQQLSRLMGGDLQVDALESGARFRFQLRLAMAEAQEELDVSNFNPLASAEVLIVLPLQAARESAAAVLQERGAHFITAESFDSVASDQWLRATHVILDLHTYQENAPQLLDWLARHGDGREPRVLVSSVPSESALAASADLPPGMTLLEEPHTRISLDSALLVGEGVLFEQRRRNGELSDVEHERIWKVLPSLSVLVVDDNRINQRVLGALLEEYGAMVSYAGDGQDALDMLQKRASDPFDLILMDCQMPVMDGYEATQRIRAGTAGEQYIKTPVIAVTAGAMGGDRLKCIESGMSDYLTKPIAQNALELAIARAFMDEAPGPEAGEAEANPLSLDSADLADEVRVELRKRADWDLDDVKRRFMGKMEIVSTLADLYLKVAPELLDRVDEALERQNYRELRSVVHEFKGMAQNLGAKKVAYLSYEIEMAALDRRLKDIVFLVAKLKLTSSTLHDLLEEHEEAVD